MVSLSNFKLERKDLLYLVVLVLLLFPLLSQMKEIPLESYERLAEAKLMGKIPGMEVANIPVFIGLIFCCIMYAILRIRFGSFITFLSIILMITSTAFVANFAANSFSVPVAAFFGYFDFPFQASAENFASGILLIPFVLLAIFGFALEKKNIHLAIAIISIILSVFYPLVALPLLTIFTAFGLEKFQKEEAEETKERKKAREAAFGIFLIFSLVLFLLGSFQTSAFALSIFSAVLVGAVFYLSDFRHKLNIFLIIAIIFLSIINASSVIFSTKRIDKETTLAMQQIKEMELDGELSIISVYKEDIKPVAEVLADKNISVIEGLEFIFSEIKQKPVLDYLLLDTLILDDPQNYSAIVNLPAKFDTYAFSQIARISEEEIAAIFVSKKGYMIIRTDERGNYIDDKARLPDGQEISRYRLLQLNATEGYDRYIYPRQQTNLTLFSILFPEKFGTGDLKITEVWKSNSSRMRLYKIE